METHTGWRTIEKGFLGALVSAVFFAVIINQLMPRLDDAYKVPVFVWGFLLTCSLGAFLTSGGPAGARWWISTRPLDDKSRDITAVLQIVLAVYLAVFVFQSGLEIFGVPLVVALLMIAWGLRRRRDWVRWLARVTYCVLLLVAVFVGLHMIKHTVLQSSYENLVWMESLTIPFVVSCWTLRYVKKHLPPSSQASAKSLWVRMVCHTLLTGVTAVAATIPLATLLGSIFRFPVLSGGFVNGPSAFLDYMVAAVIYLVIGGAVVQAVLGCVGGVLAFQIAGQRPDKVSWRIVLFGSICALPGLLVLATLDWTIGPW